MWRWCVGGEFLKPIGITVHSKALLDIVRVHSRLEEGIGHINFTPDFFFCAIG